MSLQPKTINDKVNESNKQTKQDRKERKTIKHNALYKNKKCLKCTHIQTTNGIISTMLLGYTCGW